MIFKNFLIIILIHKPTDVYKGMTSLCWKASHTIIDPFPSLHLDVTTGDLFDALLDYEYNVIHHFQTNWVIRHFFSSLHWKCFHSLVIHSSCSSVKSYRIFLSSFFFCRDSWTKTKDFETSFYGALIHCKSMFGANSLHISSAFMFGSVCAYIYINAFWRWTVLFWEIIILEDRAHMYRHFNTLLSNS